MESLCKNLEVKLYNIFNNSELPIDVKYYIVKTFFQNVENAYNEYLNYKEDDNLTNMNISKSDDLSASNDNYNIEITGDDPAEVINKAIQVVKNGISEEEIRHDSKNN